MKPQPKDKRHVTEKHREPRGRDPHKPKHFSHSEEEYENLPSWEAPITGRGSHRYYGRPVRKFLKSRVGKKWDDVYSEFRQKYYSPDIDMSWLVRKATLLKDGSVVDEGRYPLSPGQLYTSNGILHVVKPKVYVKSKPEIKITIVDDNVIFMHKGLYFKAPLNKMQDQWLSLYDSNVQHGINDGAIWFVLPDKDGTTPYRGKRKFIPRRYVRQLSAKEAKSVSLPNTELTYQRWNIIRRTGQFTLL